MIYFDNAATTPLSKTVKNNIKENLDLFGNPSSIYSIGYKSKEIIENSRKMIAECLNCKPSEIYFTSGGSESNSWALQDKFYCHDYEHHSILNNPNRQRERNHNYIYAQMLVNNETGTVFTGDIKMATMMKNNRVHCDATQAIGNIDVNVKKLGVDTLSFSGHKIHAPKGIGVLYIREGIKRPPIIYGGKQERGIRGGTENILGISALGVAVREAYDVLSYKRSHCSLLKEHLIERLNELGIDYIINGETGIYSTIPSIISLSIKGVESEAVLMQLDLDDIYVSAGSACTAGDLEPSATLKYFNVPDDYIGGTIRLSFDISNTCDEIDIFCEKLAKIVKKNA